MSFQRLGRGRCGTSASSFRRWAPCIEPLLGPRCGPSSPCSGAVLRLVNRLLLIATDDS